MSASSFFSSSLERFSSALAPAPILLFPGLGPSAQKPNVRKNGSRSWLLACYCLIGTFNYAADASTACSKHRRLFEYFPVLGEDFGHPLPTWSAMANGTQGQECYRAEVRGEADIHQCRSALTFRGLCCAQRKMNIGSSAYLTVPALGVFKREACKAKCLQKLNSLESRTNMRSESVAMNAILYVLVSAKEVKAFTTTLRLMLEPTHLFKLYSAWQSTNGVSEIHNQTLNPLSKYEKRHFFLDTADWVLKYLKSFAVSPDRSHWPQSEAG